MTKSTKTLVTIDKEIYVPVFNEVDDIYIDVCPYVPYQRKCIEYTCSCRAGASFFNNASYKQHIKTKTHHNYINNYKKYNIQIYERDETIKNLKVDLELTKRSMNRYKTIVDNFSNIVDDMVFQDC
jgi:hypothetical protein